jgi:outer membrane immunogenic protein
MSKSRILSSTGFALATAVITLGMTPSAYALDWLRGSFAGTHQVDWSGIYGGVHAGMSVAQSDSRALAAPLAQNALPNSNITPVLRDTIHFKEVNKSATTFGGFVGMNWQWDDIVLGFETDYTRSNINSNTTSGPNELYRVIGTDEWGVSSVSIARSRVTDWGTVRGRIGYAVGVFLPYITAGLAVGNIDARASTSGEWDRVNRTDPARPVTIVANAPFAGVVGRRGITYGGVVGAGVDMQLFPNTFLRGEWQHVQFASGGQRPNLSINTARVAGGVKF